MTREQRLHNLVFNGLQTFGGKFPPYGLFTDPVTGSTFSVPIDQPIGPSLDRLMEIWEKHEGEALGDTLDDLDAIKDLQADRALQDMKDAS